MFRLSLFKIREFTAGNIAGLLVSIARGGIQFMLIIWLQGIWLPLHGYNYDQTPLWAGIFLLPMTAGFLVSGPVSGILSDRFGSRGIATAGMAVFASSFVGLMLLPVNFPYWAFAAFDRAERDRQRHVRLAELLLDHGQRPAPRPRLGLGDARHVPELRHRRVHRRRLHADDRRPVQVAAVDAERRADPARACPPASRTRWRRLPPVSSLFASVLGVNPIEHLLGAAACCRSCRPSSQAALTGRTFFPSLLPVPFHSGLIVVFAVSAGLSVLAGLASLLRGKRQVPASPEADESRLESRVSRG